MASRGSAGTARLGAFRALCPPGPRSLCTLPFIVIALTAAACGAGLALLSDDSGSASDHRPLSLSKPDSNLPQWLGPDPWLHPVRSTVTNKRLETALKTAVGRLHDQEAELAVLRSLVLSQGVSKPPTPGLLSYSAQKPHQSSFGGQALSVDLAKGVGQMGLPRASATEPRVSAEPARDSRADESMDASFMQQLHHKLKTPKGLSKEILTQLGLRGAARGVAQTGGRLGEETKSVEHIQQAQAGALSLSAEECGSWQQQYSLLHANIVSGKGPQRYLTFSCRHKCGDLGEALLGLASAFMVALLTRRAFVLDWPAGGRVFDPNQVDWAGGGGRVPPGVALKGGGESLDLDSVYHTMEEDGLEQLFSQAYKTGNVVLSWRRGVIGSMMEHKRGRWPVLLKKIGLQPDKAFGCFLRYLLSPKAVVSKKLRTYFEALGSAPSGSVCVQPPPDTQATEPFFQCAQAVTQKRYKSDRDVKWLLIGGSNSAHTMAKTRHLGKVLVLASNASREPFGSDPEQDQAALGEWLLLSQCHVLVVDSSAYAVSAASYSLHSVLIYPMEPGKGRQRPASCLPEKPATLEDLMDPNKGFPV